MDGSLQKGHPDLCNAQTLKQFSIVKLTTKNNK